MKRISYTVQVPKHHAVLMRTMGRILTDFEETQGLSFVEIVRQDADDPEFGYAVDSAVGGYEFDTDEEREDAERQIRAACTIFITADNLSLQEAA